MPTDRQTQDYLLCSECEGILNEGGETWVLPLFATMERKFPFYELLTSEAPLVDEKDGAVYLAANNPRIKVDKLLHFALGIFWKASVHSWRGDTKEPKIDLGPYSENLRKWLRSERALSEYIFLTISVSFPERAQIIFNEPYLGSRDDGRSFYFHVPGMLFMMHIGKSLPYEMRALSVNRGEGSPVMVSEEVTKKLEQVYVAQYRSSRKTAALLRAKALRDEQIRGNTKA